MNSSGESTSQMASGDSTVNASTLRLVSAPLWATLQEKLPIPEQDAVRRVLGSERLDRNQSLFEEASALAEILGDVQIATKEECMRRRILHNPSRALVESEILLLMEHIARLNSAVPPAPTSRPTSSGSHGTHTHIKADHVLPQADRRQHQLMDLLTAKKLDSRPVTPQSRPASSRSSRPGSDAGSSTSQLDPRAVVEPVEAQLNAMDIDEIKQHIVEALENEYDLLLSDIEYFTQCLEEETDFQATISAPPASVGELRQLGTELERAFVEAEQRVDHHSRVERMLQAEGKSSGRVGRLRSLVGVSREVDHDKCGRSTSSSSLLRLSSSALAGSSCDSSSSMNFPLNDLRPGPQLAELRMPARQSISGSTLSSPKGNRGIPPSPEKRMMASSSCREVNTAISPRVDKMGSSTPTTQMQRHSSESLSNSLAKGFNAPLQVHGADDVCMRPPNPHQSCRSCDIKSLI